MRLLVVVNVFDPDRGGGAAVFSDLCYTLAERGIDVTVRCAYPYYPEWTDKSHRNGFRIWKYEKQGVHIERYGLFIPRNPNSLVQRMLYEASFMWSLLRSLPKGRSFDAVMVYCPLIGAVAFATLNKWLYRKPLWLNIQDLSADAAEASGISNLGFVNRLLASIQNGLFNRATVWSSISPVMIRRLRQIQTKDQPILLLPNWINNSLNTAIEALPNKIGRAPSTPLRLLYAGNIGTKQGLLRFSKTLHQSRLSFEFKIHGNGGMAEEIKQWVDHTNDARFSFGSFLSEEAFAKALHHTDFFVITEKSGSGGSFIPSKMIPGMGSGTPILAISDAESPLGQEMTHAQPGPWFSWEQLSDIPAQLQSFTSEQDLFSDWQRNAVERAALYARNEIINQFELALRDLAKGESLTRYEYHDQ